MRNEREYVESIFNMSATRMDNQLFSIYLRFLFLETMYNMSYYLLSLLFIYLSKGEDKYLKGEEDSTIKVQFRVSVRS